MRPLAAPPPSPSPRAIAVLACPPPSATLVATGARGVQPPRPGVPDSLISDRYVASSEEAEAHAARSASRVQSRHDLQPRSPAGPRVLPRSPRLSADRGVGRCLRAAAEPTWTHDDRPSSAGAGSADGRGGRRSPALLRGSGSGRVLRPPRSRRRGVPPDAAGHALGLEACLSPRPRRARAQPLRGGREAPAEDRGEPAMIEGRPSRTAEGAATRRALHRLLDDPRVHDDPLALAILGDAQAAAVRADPRRFEDGIVGRVLRAFLAVRSRIAEDALAEAVARGVRQYVVLGAGLDTFAYRNPHPGLHVFEVDHPATQAWKRQRLADSGITVPAGVTFAAVDFATEALPAALGGAGVRDDVPTF